MLDYLLEVKGLALSFNRQDGLIEHEELRPVQDLSLKLHAGEMLALVGSSGSGKSLLASAILGILPLNCKEKGIINYKGQALTLKRRQELCGKDIRLIPQSISYLNPLYTIGWQLKQSALAAGLKQNELKTAIYNTLLRYNLDSSILKLYPHQLSGGMARRILMSTATFGRPRLLIADEPTCGLDEQLVSESLKYLKSLSTEDDCAVIVITHDLAAVSNFADYVTVFIEGLSVETFRPAQVKSAGWHVLKHPYSQALWRSLPEVDFWLGLPEDTERHSHGCPFASRCERCQEVCFHKPPLVENWEREYARCYL